VPYERLRPLIGKGGDKLLMEVVGIDDESDEGNRISDERRSLLEAQYLPRLRTTPGARDLLLRLIDEGLQLVVATSASSEDLRTLLRQAGIADLVKIAASFSDVEESKPGPDIVQAALEKAGLRPDEAIMLGDTPHDIEAASAAGVRAIALRCGGWWNDAALAGAVAVYDDPVDLTVQFESSAFASEGASSEDERDRDLPSRFADLRIELELLSSAPVRDMPAVDAVLCALDETQAALKERTEGIDDHQCF
jgi:HAD superfamily hydrolase (TIGR01509 family)